MAPDPSSELRRRLRHPDPETRSEARLEIAARVRELGGDVERSARELGLTVRTVRRWRHWVEGGDDSPSSDTGPEEPEEGSFRLEATEDPDPFTDFRPEHRHPLESGGPPSRPAPPQAAPRKPVGASDSPPRSERDSESASPRPHPPGSLADAEPATSARTPSTASGRRRVAFVLHAHLPWVLGHGRWPHGEEWLTEAALHCYLPLLRSLRRLTAAGHRDLLAFSITPVLAAQLADPQFPPAMERDLKARRTAAADLARIHPLGRWWERQLEALAELWRELGGDLLGALRSLNEVDAIELSSSAATHPYLPLLHREEHVR
ncbi:MAG: helix-turn-helix domain-containing protein, partial [Thermoanaerobaculia bacterium]|nr:helix-turn-helix domain-containing protein [Thermoanaerobaculia bacterium]